MLFLCAVEAVTAAAETASAEQSFDALPRKTLADYDRELLERSIGPNPGARTAFRDGLAALDSYELRAAHEAFLDSRKSLNTYTATFNAALTRQLDLDAKEARSLYLEAGSLEPADPTRTDPMRYINLAWLVARFDRRVANEALMFALRLPLSDFERGRVLLHQGLIQWQLGDQAAALEALGASEEAFARANHALGAAVARAKRGNLLIQQRKAKEGAALLIEAISRLQALGAGLDEAVARVDLAGLYLGLGGASDRAESELRQAIELAEAAGALLPHARALNNLGIFHSRAGQLAQAESEFEQALEMFRRIRDPGGEGEATNNLGLLALGRQRLDLAFERFSQAVRLYQRADRPGRAFDKALTVAEQFHALQQPKRARDFLDIAAALPPRDDAERGRLLLVSGQLRLESDPRAAERDLTAARELLARSRDGGRVEAAERLIATARRRWYTRLLSYFLCAGIVMYALVAPRMYGFRRRVGAFLRSASQAAVRPVRSVADSWRRALDRWVGSEPPDTLDERNVLEAMASHRRRSMRMFFLVAIAATLLMDASTLTGPSLRYVAEMRRTLDGWRLPPGMEEQLRALLDRLTLSVLAHAVTQLLTFALWLAVALFVYDALDRGVLGALRRWSPAPSQPLDPSSRVEFRVRMHEGERQRLRLLLLLAALALWFYPDVVPRDSASIQHAAWGLLAWVLLIEAARFWAASRLIRSLPPESRKTAFDWLHLSARHPVVSLLLNTLVFVYLVTPVFYIATRAVQKTLVYPLFKQTTQQFLSAMLEGVTKFGTVILEGNSALIFARMERAYDPTAGAGQLWPDLLSPLLPYAFFAWAIVLFFRLNLPWAWSFPRWDAVGKIVRIGAIVTISGLGLQAMAVHLFRVDRTLSLALPVVAFIATLYLRQALDPPKLCPSCKRRNPADADFCLKCGTKLASRQEA